MYLNNVYLNDAILRDFFWSFDLLVFWNLMSMTIFRH